MASIWTLQLHSGSFPEKLKFFLHFKLAIKEHDTDSNQRNIELEGTFDQIKQASAMVGELIMNVGAAHHHPPPAKPSLAAAPANNFKTKVCEHFTKGSCTFGERCHFAHGDGELRKSGV